MRDVSMIHEKKKKMKTRTIHLTLPEAIEIDDRDVLLAVAARLFETGKLSMGQAAEVCGLSKRAFIEILGAYGISVINHSPDELKKDSDNAGRYHR